MKIITVLNNLLTVCEMAYLEGYPEPSKVLLFNNDHTFVHKVKIILKQFRIHIKVHFGLLKITIKDSKKLIASWLF